MAKSIDRPTEQDNETIPKKNRKEIFDAKIWNAILKKLRNDPRRTDIQFLYPFDGPQWSHSTLKHY